MSNNPGKDFVDDLTRPPAEVEAVTRVIRPIKRAVEQKFDEIRKLGKKVMSRFEDQKPTPQRTAPRKAPRTVKRGGRR